MIFKRENPFLLKAFHSGWMERPAWSVSIVYVLGLTLLPLFNSWQIKLKLSFARSAQTRLLSEVECGMRGRMESTHIYTVQSENCFTSSRTNTGEGIASPGAKDAKEVPAKNAK